MEPELQYCIDHGDSKLLCSKLDRFSILANPSSHTSQLLISRHRVISALMLHLLSFFWKKECRKIVLFRQASKPASEHNLDNFWSSDSCSNFRSYSCTKFPRCCALVCVSATEGRVGISIVSKWSGASSFPQAPRSSDNSLHKSTIAPWTLSWFAEINLRRGNSMFSSLKLKCIDLLPCPLLLNSPLSKALEGRNIGWPDSKKFVIMFSAILSQGPSVLSVYVPYHFFSDPSPKKDQRPRGNLRA